MTSRKKKTAQCPSRDSPNNPVIGLNELKDHLRDSGFNSDNKIKKQDSKDLIEEPKYKVTKISRKKTLAACFVSSEATDSEIEPYRKVCNTDVKKPSKSINRIAKPKTDQDVLLSDKKEFKYIRSYKVGMRAPEDRIRTITTVMREGQVLNYFVSADHGLNFESFMEHININNARDGIITEYRTIFNKYKYTNLSELSQLLMENRKKLDRLKNYDEDHQIQPFKFDPAIDLNTCTLRDYRLTASFSILQLNHHFNNQALNFMEFIRDYYIDSKDLRDYLNGKSPYFDFYSLLEKYNAWCSTKNIEKGKYAYITLQKHIVPLLKSYRKTSKKISSLFGVLIERLLLNSTSIFLVFNQVPRFMRNFMSKRWGGLNPVWVRNSMVGWRRKFDSFLPSQLQLEPYILAQNKFVEILKNSSVISKFSNIIGIIQKYHCSHLLGSPTLSSLFNDVENRQQYMEFINNYTFESMNINNMVTSFTIDEIIQASYDLKDDVNRFIEKAKQSGKNIVTSIRFIEKIDTIIEALYHDKYRLFLENYICGQYFTRALSKLLSQDIKKYKSVYTALRGIIAFAYARKYDFFGDTGIVKKLNGFDPSKCATFPFCSSNRKHKIVPFHSTSQNPLKIKGDDNSKPINFTEQVTERFRENKPVWVDIPVHSMHQIIDNGLIRTHTKAGHQIRMQLIPSRKILRCIDQGAKVLGLNIKIPKFPNYKIRASISLGFDTRDAFIHSTRFKSEFDSNIHLNLPRSVDCLGSDFNVIGNYMISLGTPTQELDLTPLMDYLGFNCARNKLETYSDIILPKLQRALDRYTKLDDKMRIRNIKAKIKLLHAKVKNIYHDLLNKIVMVYVYIGKKTNTRYFGWDDISKLSTRGLRGRLALLVSYMPLDTGLRGLFTEWAQDFDILSSSDNLIDVNPHTSKICWKCGKRTMKPLSDDYHIVKCGSCGYITNRHQNASCVASQSIQKLVSAIL